MQITRTIIVLKQMKTMHLTKIPRLMMIMLRVKKLKMIMMQVMKMNPRTKLLMTRLIQITLMKPMKIQTK